MDVVPDFSGKLLQATEKADVFRARLLFHTLAQLGALLPNMLTGWGRGLAGGGRAGDTEWRCALID
eukprot:84802-Pelagomonas_calceolata.AAC.1